MAAWIGNGHFISLGHGDRGNTLCCGAAMVPALRNFSKNLIVWLGTTAFRRSATVNLQGRLCEPRHAGSLAHSLLTRVLSVSCLWWLFTDVSQLHAEARGSTSTARVVKVQSDTRSVVSPTYCLFTSIASDSVMCLGQRPAVSASGVILTTTGLAGRFTVTEVEPMKQGCDGLWTAKGLLTDNNNATANTTGRTENWVLFERQLSPRARFLGSGKSTDIDLPALHDPDGDQVIMFDRDGDGTADSVLSSQPCDPSVTGVVAGLSGSQCAANWVRRGRTGSWRLAQTFQLGNC
jgi:hypothetical protein